MGKRITMADIAREVGVSKATVSMALRGDSRVSEETKRAVEDAAEKLGYQENPALNKWMSQVKSQDQASYQATIAVIDVDHDPNIYEKVPTYTSWLEGMRKQATRRGYSLAHFRLHEEGRSIERLAQIMKSRNVGGILIPATSGYVRLPSDFHHIWYDFACVLVGIRNKEPVMHYAANDQFMTAQEAVKTVVKKGYRKVGLAMLRVVDDLVDQKFSAGYEVGLQRYAGGENAVPFFYTDEENGATGVADWIRTHELDVVMCVDSRVKTWIVDAGYRIPEEIGVIHLDYHLDMADWAGMYQNNQQVGEAAVNLLIHQIQNGQVGPPYQPLCTLVSSLFVDGPSLSERR